MKPNFPQILGVYASHPALDFSGSDDELHFYREIGGWSEVTGYEIPFNGSLHDFGVTRLAKILPQGKWIVVTPLPGQMQKMALAPETGFGPEFGLGSRSEKHRLMAIEFFLELEKQTLELLKLRPDLKLLAVECHSGPVNPDAMQFEKSLVQLLKRDFFRRYLLVEHCDSWSSEHPVAKGFLPFAQELEIAKKLGVKIVINWARSFIDTQSVDGPRQQLAEAIAGDVAAGIIFSGGSFDHPLYGSSYDDRHAPLQSVWTGSAPELLAMTDENVRECRELARSAGLWQGIKVQPLPKTLGIHERLAFLRAHVEAIFG